MTKQPHTPALYVPGTLHAKSGHAHHTPPQAWIILCDFDGTISLEDTTDVLLERFGMSGWQALEQDWLAGKIGSKECMSAQIALLNVSPEVLYQQLAALQLDPFFNDFVASAAAYQTPIQIVSDGLDTAIEFILARHGLGNLPVFANQLIAESGDRWSLRFPHANAECLNASGHCKCTRAAEVKITAQLTRQHILYIGDGTSDFCVSNRVDMVLAKGKLIDYCRTRGIPHYPIQDFNDAILLLPEILPSIAPDTVHPMAIPVAF